jgi:hypothetical protein
MTVRASIPGVPDLSPRLLNPKTLEMRWPLGSLAFTSGVAYFALLILSSVLAQDASPANPSDASTVDAANVAAQPSVSQPDAPQTPDANAPPPAAPPSTRIDPANGAVGQADQARGWDQGNRIKTSYKWSGCAAHHRTIAWKAS